jgi:hypothetical protein
MAVKVPRDVFEGLEAVRESGQVNMLDARGVQVVANDLECYALVVWLEDQFEERNYGMRLRRDAVYPRGVFEGFEPEEE